MTLDAQWFDGRDSRARAVRLERDGDRLLLQGEGGDVVAWPLAGVVLEPRLGSTSRILRRAGHGHLVVADSPVLAAWFPRPASRVEAMADWLERRRTAIAVAAVGTALAVFATFRYGVPAAAESIAAHMPRAVEVAVSTQALAVIDRLHLEPSRLQRTRRATLKRAFAELVAGEPRSTQMQLDFVAAPEIGANAFALPDGRIRMTDELVLLAEDDDELLAVLAHEAGHHVHRHGLRQAIEGSSVLLIAGIAFGDASGSSLAATLPAVLLGSGYSRGHEREADAYAFALLRRRGISPAAFARVMARLAKAHGMEGEGGVSGYFSSHPATPERIRAAEAAGLPAPAPKAGPGSPGAADPVP